MPHVRVNGVNLFYTDQGSGSETIVFSHGLLWSHLMFEKQVELLQKNYRVIAYDHRGQGGSEFQGPFDMDTLGDDAAELVKKLVGGPVHFMGLSMGGFTGMRLAARYPELVKSLILLETSANAEPVENHPKYKMLNGLVKWFGILPMIADQVMPIMFAKSWLENPANKAEVKRWKFELRKNKKSITQPVEGVIYRSGVEDELEKIQCPTMIIVGDEDVATKPDKAKFINMGIKDSILHEIQGAGHSSCIEKPDEVNQLISSWLEKH